MKRTAIIIAVCVLIVGGLFACNDKKPAKDETAADTIEKHTIKTETNTENTKSGKVKVTKPEKSIVKSDGKYYAVVKTSKGTFKIEFMPDIAPMTVTNFIQLAKAGYFDGLTYHRVIKGFMIQGGDPDGNGMGGPGYNIDAEFSKKPHLKGTVSMARKGNDINSAGSQWFVCLGPQPFLDGKYTVFGQVIEGMDVVEAIGEVPTTGNRRHPQDQPIEPVYMEKITIEGI